jgi:hypothetical protein
MKSLSKAKLAGAFAIALATATTAFAATPASASQYHEMDRGHRDFHQFDRHEHRGDFGLRFHHREHRHGFWFGHR